MRFAVIVLCLLPALAVGANDDGSDPFLRPSEMQLAGNGDVLGWQVAGQRSSTTELVDSEAALLQLELSLAGRNVGDDVAWRRVAVDPDGLGEFVGRLARPAIEVRRRYTRGDTPGMIVHEVQITSLEGPLPADFRATVHMPPHLRRHSPIDRSLGSVLYGYSRVFSASEDGKLEPLTERLETGSAVLAARHVAVAVESSSANDHTSSADPQLGVTMSVTSGRSTASLRQQLGALELRSSTLSGTAYEDLLYPALWWPLRALAQAIEWALEVLTTSVHNAGLAVVAFALLLRAALAPLGIWSIRQQQRFTAVQQEMKPVLDEISRTYTGAEKSERILQTYKRYGISPLSGLKGSSALFVQLPILIAFFAVTTESALFRGAKFLWVGDLSLPDYAIALPFSMPGFGAHLNVLPIALGIVSVVAAMIQRARTAAASNSGLLLALAFVLLFYSCAAALVLYWLTVNAVQIVENACARARTPSTVAAPS